LCDVEDLGMGKGSQKNVRCSQWSPDEHAEDCFNASIALGEHVRPNCAAMNISSSHEKQSI